MASTYAIEIADLRKTYGDTDVIKGIDLTVQRGSLFALLGPNGAGKSTTVRILSTLINPSGGSAHVNGFDVVSEADSVRRSIGLVSQSMAIDYVHSGRENLVMLGRLHRIGKSAARRRAGELLEQFDLLEAADRPVMTYSGGMKRRLDLAVSLITAPPVVFLDEPTVGLDPRSRRTMWAAIEALLDSGSTVLLTTQYLEEADQLADRVAVIDHGSVIADGTPAELKRSVGDERMELVFSAEGDFLKAKEVVTGEGLVYEDATRTLSLPTGDSAFVVSVMSRVERAGVQVDSFAVHKPTLDDVFLKLTHHSATEPQQEGAAVQ